MGSGLSLLARYGTLALVLAAPAGCGPGGPAPAPGPAGDPGPELRKVGGAVAEQVGDLARDRIADRAERKPLVPGKGLLKPKGTVGKIGRPGAGFVFDLVDYAVERRAEYEAAGRTLREAEAARVAALHARLASRPEAPSGADRWGRRLPRRSWVCGTSP